MTNSSAGVSEQVSPHYNKLDYFSFVCFCFCMAPSYLSLSHRFHLKVKAPVLSSHQRQLSLQMSQVKKHHLFIIIIIIITTTFFINMLIRDSSPYRCRRSGKFSLFFITFVLINATIPRGYLESLIKLSSCYHPPYIHVILIVQVQEKQITNHHHHRHPHHHFHLVDRPLCIPPSHPPSAGAREANQEQNSADSD